MWTGAGDTVIPPIPPLPATNQAFEIRARVSCVRGAVVYRVCFEANHLSLAAVAAVGVPVDRDTAGFPLPGHLLLGAVPYRLEVVAAALYPLSWADRTTNRLSVVR